MVLIIRLLVHTNIFIWSIIDITCVLNGGKPLLIKRQDPLDLKFRLYKIEFHLMTILTLLFVSNPYCPPFFNIHASHLFHNQLTTTLPSPATGQLSGPPIHHHSINLVSLSQSHCNIQYENFQWMVLIVNGKIGDGWGI